MARSTRKISLNIARSQFKHRKEAKEYCPKTSLTYTDIDRHIYG